MIIDSWTQFGEISETLTSLKDGDAYGKRREPDKIRGSRI